MRPRLLNQAFADRFPSIGWPWLIPPAVAAFLYLSPLPQLERGLGILIGLGVALLAARRPDRALLVLLGLLPFQTLLLAQLYALGAPLSIMRPLATWKEAVVLGLVLAAVRDFHRSDKRFDWLDWLAVGFIGLAGAYALLGPSLLANAPSATEVRFFGFRQSAEFVILLLAARHIRFPAGFPDRALRLVLAMSVVVAAVGIYGFFFSSSWNDFVVGTVDFSRYQRDVLGVQPLNPSDYRVHGFVGDRQILRIGSVFLSAASCAFYLLLGLAVAMERLRREGSGLAALGALVLIGGALVLTQTRSAIASAFVVAFLALRPTPGRGHSQRLRFVVLILALVLLALPAARATGLAERTAGAATGEEESAPYHVKAFVNGVGVMTRHPLGQGLGTAAGTGQRFANPNVVISENNYLSVGNELGFPAMAVFIAMILVALRQLLRTTRERDETAPAAVAGAAVALSIGAFFLYPWTEFAVALTLWGLAGAVLGAASQRSSTADERSSHRPFVPAPRPPLQAARVVGGGRSTP